MVIGMLSQIVCGNLTGMIKILEFHILFRWLSAATCALMFTSGQMICEFYLILKNNFSERKLIVFFVGIFFFVRELSVVDITSGRARIIVSILFELFWSIGLIFLPVFSLFIADWWELYIAISMPTILMVILYR